jgi:isoleucyl-tRNA synthetase
MKSSFENIKWDEICVTSQCSINFKPREHQAIPLSPTFNGVLEVNVTRAEGVKCERCWKILPISEMDKEFPNLSKRDADAVRYFIEQKQAA